MLDYPGVVYSGICSFVAAEASPGPCLERGPITFKELVCVIASYLRYLTVRASTEGLKLSNEWRSSHAVSKGWAYTSPS